MVVLDTTKVQIFKQITTTTHYFGRCICCFRYHKGTDFQANHNLKECTLFLWDVVLDTTKVQIFKQITTLWIMEKNLTRCFRYHKGTDFQANHNHHGRIDGASLVVLDTTKVQIFKQITTARWKPRLADMLF